MKQVFASYNTIVSPLGFDTLSNINHIQKGISGIVQHCDTSLLPVSFYAACIESQKLDTAFNAITDNSIHTKLEKMMLLSLYDTLNLSKVKISDRTGLLISTTKGNIDVLQPKSSFKEERAYLTVLGSQIKDYFGFKNNPIIISNACVSGLLSISIAKRLILAGVYDEVFIISGDIVSEFTLSGFYSFQAISNEPCKPFSKNRSGITIGEAAASILITNNDNHLSDDAVMILGDSTTNDANHISGPSRTGEGLVKSIQNAFDESGLSATAIDYVSAHGTATLYNDEMEAIALSRTNLNNVPVNSLKGYYGHTLGASGLLETIVGMQSLKNNMLYACLGFDELGVSREINVIEKNMVKELKTFLKTASGFGGSNTAVVFQKLK